MSRYPVCLALVLVLSSGANASAGPLKQGVLKTRPQPFFQRAKNFATVLNRRTSRLFGKRPAPGGVDWRHSDVRYDLFDAGNGRTGATLKEVVKGSGQMHYGDTSVKIFDPVGYGTATSLGTTAKKPLSLFKWLSLKGHSVGDKTGVSTPMHFAPFQTHESVYIGEMDNAWIEAALRLTLPAKRPSFLGALRFARNEGWAKMDYGSLIAQQGSLIIHDKVAYDQFDFGNLVWGAAMKTLGIPLPIAQLGAEYNSLSSHAQLDSSSDEHAIVRGYRLATKLDLRHKIYPTGAQETTDAPPSAPAQ